jgi:hypothetical protein
MSRYPTSLPKTGNPTLEQPPSPVQNNPGSNPNSYCDETEEPLYDYGQEDGPLWAGDPEVELLKKKTEAGEEPLMEDELEKKDDSDPSDSDIPVYANRYDLKKRPKRTSSRKVMPPLVPQKPSENPTEEASRSDLSNLTQTNEQDHLQNAFSAFDERWNRPATGNPFCDRRPPQKPDPFDNFLLFYVANRLGTSPSSIPTDTAAERAKRDEERAAANAVKMCGSHSSGGGFAKKRGNDCYHEPVKKPRVAGAGVGVGVAVRRASRLVPRVHHRTSNASSRRSSGVRKA